MIKHFDAIRRENGKREQSPLPLQKKYTRYMKEVKKVAEEEELLYRQHLIDTTHHMRNVVGQREEGAHRNTHPKPWLLWYGVVWHDTDATNSGKAHLSNDTEQTRREQAQEHL